MAHADDLGSRHTALCFMSVATRGSARQTRSQMTHPEVDQPYFQTPVLALAPEATTSGPSAQRAAAPPLTSRLALKRPTAASMQGGVVTRSPPHLLWAPLFCLVLPGHFPAKSCMGARLLTARASSLCLRTDWSRFPVDDDDSFYKYFVSVAEILTKNKLSITSEIILTFWFIHSDDLPV